MAVPKRRSSKARARRRRAANMKISAKSYTICSRCGHLKLPHRICPNCGYYKNRQVLEVREEAAEEY